jgi:hypothetical protein
MNLLIRTDQYPQINNQCLCTGQSSFSSLWTRITYRLSLVSHNCNPSTQEAEVGGSQVQDHHGLQ